MRPKSISRFFALAAIAVAQTRPDKQVMLTAGTTAEIVLHISDPRQGDTIDILLSSPVVGVSVELPDGTELTSRNAEQLGYAWEIPSEQEVKDAENARTSLLLVGPGRHVDIGLPKTAPSGDYRIRLDARNLVESATVATVYIPFANTIIAAQRAIPGVKIAGPTKLVAGSKEVRLAMTWGRSAGESLLDVVVTDPQVRVSLQLPDGALVTRATAKIHGIEWVEVPVPKWPFEDKGGGDDFGFGSAVASGMILPIEGTHQLISFVGSALTSGRYVLRFDATRSARQSEATAMLLPFKAFDKAFDDELTHGQVQ